MRDPGSLTAYKVIIDIPTSILILLMLAGFPFLGYMQHLNIIAPWMAILFGSLIMNLSFTAWHEPAHGNYSRYKVVNNVAGYIASLISVYPGYFARRREHLAHHKWEGVEGKDPVYSRIQNTNPWLFGIHLAIRDIIGRNPSNVPMAFCKYTPGQKIADRISICCALGIVVGAALTGYFPEVICVWIIPRAIILFLHAYYICLFPHFISEGGYRKFRVRRLNLFWRFITVEQTFHGIHHKWPFIPWHKYKNMLDSRKDLIAENEIELL